MKMTPLVVFLGSTWILACVMVANVLIPVEVFHPSPSRAARPYSALELEGRAIYVKNGCVYCHSQDARPMDWGIGSGEAAEPGDYYYDSPHLIGSERNGPDLMREGGYHTDDWHWAHFENPRSTRPQSFMPSFRYIRGHDRVALIAYIQCLGGRDSVKRASKQRVAKAVLVRYYNEGPAANVAHLNATIPTSWFTMPNPVPVTYASVSRGKLVYEAYCVGCHGENGDGRGIAKAMLNPPPMDFTLIQATAAKPSAGMPGYPFSPARNEVSVLTNGAIYYAVLHGLEGSAMPAFKGQLESEKIWDVGNYIGAKYMGWPLEPTRGRFEELARKPDSHEAGGNAYPE